MGWLLWAGCEGRAPWAQAEAGSLAPWTALGFGVEAIDELREEREWSEGRTEPLAQCPEPTPGIP